MPQESIPPIIERFANKPGSMPIEQMERAGSVGQIWKPVFVIFNHPTVEGAMADASEGDIVVLNRRIQVSLGC